MAQYILSINGGSSSLKFALFENNDTLPVMFRGAIEHIGEPSSVFWVTYTDHSSDFTTEIERTDISSSVELLSEWIGKQLDASSILALGYRIIHGGSKHSEPERITDEMITYLQSISSLDPDHMPQNIQLIQSFRALYPESVHVACFDTAFHRELPPVASVLPLPRALEVRGVKRYGFHGLSYASIVDQLQQDSMIDMGKSKIIIAHLGSGASLTAVCDGKSIDTSMSFTPASGIPMGTRSGDIDPGILLFLMQTEGYTVKQIHDMVNFESGLRGMSETSGDVLELLKNENSDPRAKIALSVFCYQVKKTIGAYAAALGGLDILVFTGGIGERSSMIRKRICENLQFLGIDLADHENDTNALVISKAPSRVQVYVMHVNEELAIAKQTAKFI